MRIFPQSLKTRVALATLAVLLVGLWSLSLYISEVHRADMQRDLSDQQLSMAALVAENVNSAMARRLSALERMATIVAPALKDPIRLQRLLNDQVSTPSLFSGGLVVIDGNGVAIGDLPRSAGRIGIDYRGDDWIERPLKEGRPMVGRPLVGKALKVPVFAMTVPIRSQNGAVIGVLAGVVDLGKPNFLDSIADGRYGKDGGYLLVAPQYRLIVMASDKRRIMEALPAPGADPLLDSFARGYVGAGISTTPGGVQFLVAAKPVPVAGWYVAAETPVAEAFAPITRLLIQMLSATIVLTILSATLTWWLVKRQLSPMLAAVRTLTAYPAANHPVEPLPVLLRDEVGQLMDSFNGLLASLAERDRANERERSRLQTILRTASDGIHILDEHGLLVEANDAFLSMLGYDRSAIGHLGVGDWDADGSGAVLQDRRDLVEKQGHIVFEARHRCRDGSEIDVEVSASGLVIDGKGYLYAASRDITERKRAAQIAEEYRSVVQASIDGFWVVDGAGRIVEANESMCRMHGYSRDELLGLRIPDLDPDESVADTEARIRGINEAGQVLFEARHRCKDGSIIDVEVSVVCVPKLGERMFCFIRNITERKRVEARLKLAADVFTHAREGITVTDASGMILEVNDTFSRITGYTRAEALGQNPSLLKSGRQLPEFYEGMWRSLNEKGYWTGEIWNRRKDGEVYAEILTISAVCDAAGKVQNYVGLFSDITALKAQQKQLEHIAHYDVLTGLPNRVLLADRLQQTMAQSQRRSGSLAVVYLDLDGFKSINDQFGHAAGDELLIAIARRMKVALRDGDTLSRFGGDEFIAVLVDLERAEDCEPILARLLQAAAYPTEVDNATLQVSASVGVTIYPADNADAEQLIRHADQAMYQAKQAGKNRYHLFDVEQDTAVKVHRESLGRIRRALEQREFVLYYQPKVNMKTGEVIGAEALIRWQHPERGVLSPGAFLPVIENDPLGIEVGSWVIDTALSQISEWQRIGLKLRVSVNVAARQLQHADFVADLSDLLARYADVKPAQLELEILETSALEDVAKVSEIMEACHELGVGFALDDFGTGYSSLTYLKHLPAQWLKIDQTFVRDMLGDTDDLAIVEAVVGLSAAFRRRVIAEGVETIAHGELLLPLGCECGQGYGIARPMPAAALPDWVAGWRPDPSWTAWRERIPGPDDMAIVFAEVEHRHWMSSLEIFLTEDEAGLPPMDVHDCRFGQWLDGAGHSRHRGHPAFPGLLELHERVHAVARDLVDLHVQGKQADVLERLKELHALRSELITKLRTLLGLNAEAAMLN